MAKLTAVAVKNFRPGKGRREVPDSGCPGLYLIIQASGTKSWALRFRKPNGLASNTILGLSIYQAVKSKLGLPWATH